MINPKTLVNIDRLAYPVYWGFDLICTLFRSGKLKNHQYSERVAVIKMLGIGSITRIFTTLRKQDVDLDKIEFYTLSGNRELCEILGITNVQFISVDSLPKFVNSCIKALKKIRNQQLKVIVDYERSSNLLGIFRSMATVFSSTKTVSFYNLKVDRQSNKDFQFRLKGRPINELISLTIPFLPKSDRPSDLAQLEQQRLIPAHSVLININASDYMSHRRYPRKSFAMVIESLLTQDKDLNIFLIGAPNEKGYVDSIINEFLSRHDRLTNCCGVWNLKQLISALEDCRCLITNDSGPMHLAAMKGIKTIAIWGPTTPDTFGYEEYENVVNIQSGRSCAPCFTHPKSRATKVCDGRIDCMRDIQSEDIIAATMKVLTQYPVTA